MAASFLQAAVDTTEATIYTFSSQSLGTAAADRYIVVAIAARGLGTTRTISSVTVGGVSATINVQTPNITSNTSLTGIVIAAVPTGTTGDIVITFDAQMLRCGIGLYRVTNLVSATPTDTDGSTAADPSVTLTTVDGGIAIGVGFTQDTAPQAAWTGATENYDNDL